MTQIPTDFLPLIARVEEQLAICLPKQQLTPTDLHLAMRYSVLGGGKRVRALLVYAAGFASGAPLQALDNQAVAVELIHAYSLIHDDLPAMDDDDLRRGNPTCHKKFDEATAILAGDALQALAFEVLANASVDKRSGFPACEMIKRLAVACGSQGMAGGQAIDLASVGKELSADELAEMHGLKTGALISASVFLGGSTGSKLNPAQIQALESYGATIGLAFQIHDDILDVLGSTQQLGKTAGADQALGKPTYPACVGMAASQAMAEALLEDALAAIDCLDKGADHLRLLARYIVGRQY